MCLEKNLKVCNKLPQFVYTHEWIWKKRIELMERIKQLGQWDREERRWVFSLDLFIEESFMNKRMVHGSLYGRAYNSKELPYK